MRKNFAAVFLFLIVAFSLKAEKRLTDYVNPFLGTAPLTNPADIGFAPPWRVWAGLTFPGASLPNAMVQLSPVTKFGSGAGYEYEDPVIYGFAHSNCGHWNYCNIPILPVTGPVNPDDFGSTFSHKRESAHPGYYQVYLERYGINAELTTTLRCGYHRYTYPAGKEKELIVNLSKSNERVHDWDLKSDGDRAFEGYQVTRETVYFYARANTKIRKIKELWGHHNDIYVIHFADTNQPLEIKIGLSFVSEANAKLNLETELAGKSFDEVKRKASDTWEKLLSKIQVTGGTERQKELFYSCLYRSFLWPALRSDVNGEFLDADWTVVKKNFQYYTVPSLWDTYRNKLVLLGLLTPKVADDVIQSLIDRGEITGFVPTFFHGDHAAVFIAGSYLRGLRGFDVKTAYKLLLRNATIEGGPRPFIAEYMKKGYVSTPDIAHPDVETHANAGVTKTLEYAYDDYAVALLAKALNDETNYHRFMARSHSFTNVFDPSTGLMRGRLANGDWVKPFNPQYPYYEYMYREANAWQSSFFAPQDTEGLIHLYPSKAAFEKQLDRLFSIPWNPDYMARNITCFIGQYCQGNQPDHGFPYLYYFVGKQEKSQAILDEIMSRFYGMGRDGLALCGMDDCGEMSSWYVFNAMGFYPYSPADPDYIVSVPIFDRVKIHLAGHKTFTILKKNSGKKIADITYDGQKITGYFIPDYKIRQGGKLVITTGSATSSRAAQRTRPATATASRPARPRPPTRDPHTPGFVPAKELPDGTVPSPTEDGNFILGPTHRPAPEMIVNASVPQGTIYHFTMNSADSKFYPGIARGPGSRGFGDPNNPAQIIVTNSHPAPYTRHVAVYVPKQYIPGTVAPFIVGADGPDRMLFTALNNLIAERKVPVMIAISIGNGGGDGPGSERGLEYDTLSGKYAEFVENEVLPLVEKKCHVKLTKDPEGRATMGGSSGGACAMSMAWFHPGLYHRVLSYSGTFVNQQWPYNAATPHGAWEFHERLIPDSPREPIRIWLEVGDHDLLNPNPKLHDHMHDWVVANERMARVLAAKGYPYQFVFARNAGHVDRRVKQQTLPEALEWLWQDYAPVTK